jgi:hypothetical protein
LAENPLATVGRLFGGLVLMQGGLGHQVLGQLVIMNTNEVAMAAASVVLAASSGQRSAVGQMALRTVAPALAVRALLTRQEERIDRKRVLLEQRERAFEQRARRFVADACERELRHRASVGRGRRPKRRRTGARAVSQPLLPLRSRKR